MADEALSARSWIAWQPTGTRAPVALIATVPAVTSSPTPKHLGRLMEGPFHVTDPRAHQALFCHGTGVISGLPARGYFGRERPPQGVLRKCELRSTPAPAPGSKKGGSLPSTSAFPVRAPASGNLVVTTGRKGRSGNAPV